MINLTFILLFTMLSGSSRFKNQTCCWSRW